ncbi:solute carrier family 24 (sodium/potassium/calcium exchanger), member 6 [Entomortierella parvispora]|uniref:Solute carrier family 24 (Sodium/potassium/calcium exchanger), member 6 n=1 Tax=Entomortierella parvispora TaxID=205924 RepID=A0A9P3HH69_9FUNG|nr:solute carrier family 24 (sodium/potassium/calcium exchanger), member 6 [Entomortierella parvispora]
MAGSRPFYLVLTLFLFVQTATSLWPRQFLRSNTASVPSHLWKRDLLEDDPQCQDVWSHPDQCAYVQLYCSDYPAGLINYLHFYFCDLRSAPVVAVIILAVWMVFLFGFVGVAASDFFCPNLNTIAKKLHLSESMTGVTFLAFGNGSPDVFSTFSAMGAGSASLAIGELVGAASFITSVVVGSMAIIKPFKVSRAPFLRDVIFFTGCVLFTLFAVIDGKITLAESLFLILYYLIYVSFVVVGNWWHQRAKSERELEERARNLYEDEDDDNTGGSGDESLVPDEEQALLSAGDPRKRKPLRINTQFLGPYDSYEDEEHDDGDGAEDSISLRPPGTPNAMRHRPSLLSAVEFHDVVRSLTLSGSRGRVASYDPSYYGPRSSGPRTPGLHRQYSARSAVSAGVSQIPSPIVRPVLYPGSSSESQHSPNRDLSSSPLPMDLEDSDHEQRSSMERLAHLEENAAVHHSLILPDPHDRANQHLGHIHNAQEFSSRMAVTSEPPRSIPQKLIHGFKTVQPIYFPTLLHWDQKSHFVKFLAITSVPMVLLLTLTLPVVELHEEEEDDESINNQESDLVPRIVIEGAEPEPEPEQKYDGWSRTATTTQMLLAPIFVATVISSAAQEGYFSILGALGIGAVGSYVVHRFSNEEQPPRYYGSLCFVGFFVAITWIFLVANEVVGILQAFGMIFGLSDAILGLTIFAMGNSLGDLVANITIAKMGFPRMAFSACFGGPLLNMLLGVGISGTYQTLRTGEPIPLKVSPTLFVSLIGVLLTLLTAVVFVPRNGYKMSRAWGWYLLIVYLVCTVTNVVVEILSTNKDRQASL